MSYQTRIVTIPTFQVQIGDRWFRLGDIMVELAGLEDTDERSPIDVTEPYLGRILEKLQFVCPGRGGFYRSPSFDEFNNAMKALNQAQMKRTA